MKLEHLTNDADQIRNIEELNKIVQQPRQGKIYVYHDGFVANDKSDNKDLRGISNMVKRLAQNNEIMPFQKRLKDNKYIYFFVR